MSEERKKILEMLAEGKVSPEEANDLLSTLDKGSSVQPKKKARILKINIRGGDGEKVNVNLPLSLAKVALKFIPQDAKQEIEEKGVDIEDILSSVSEELTEGKLVDIQDGEESVVITVE